MSTESERVKSFGKLEDGLRQASDWYLWGPYVSERTTHRDISKKGGGQKLKMWICSKINNPPPARNAHINKTKMWLLKMEFFPMLRNVYGELMSKMSFSFYFYSFKTFFTF